MKKNSHSQFLSLVVDDDKLQQRKTYIDWLLHEAPSPLPDNCQVIKSLDTCPTGFSDRELRELIEELVSSRQIDRVHIGTTQHLIRNSLPVLDQDEEKILFQLEIAKDLEAEKQLLYSIIIILELVVIGLFLRQGLLDSNFLALIF